MAKDLKASRAWLKGYVSRLESQAAQADDMISVELASHEANKLSERLRDLEIDYHAVEDAQKEDFQELESIYDRIAAAMKLLARSKHSLEAVAKEAAAKAHPSITTAEFAPGANLDQSVKLPRLDLPSFDGNQSAWLTFRDIFNNAVGKSTALTGSHKLSYLARCLKGDAARILEGIPISDANFKTAWDLICGRYDVPDENINFQFSRLLQQPAMAEDNYHDIQKLVDVTQASLRVLETFVGRKDMWDSFMQFLLSSKLDASTKRLWQAERLKDTAVNLDAMLQFLKTRARVLQIASPSSKGKTGRSELPSSRHPTKKQTLTTQVCACLQCGASHRLHQCPEFMTLSVAERGDVVRKAKCCTNCLRQHAVTDCASPNRCKLCRKPHHSLLHVRNKPIAPSRMSSGLAQRQGASPVAGGNAEARGRGSETDAPSSAYATSSLEGSSIIASSAVLGISESAEQLPDSALTITTRSPFVRDVLLSTAKITVADSAGAHHAVRALIDCGSEASYISQAIAGKLRLPCRPLQIQVQGLGGVNVAKPSRAVLLQCRSSDQTYAFDVHALLLPTVSVPLPRRKLNTAAWTHLSNLKLADEQYHSPSDVHVLLGADVYCQFLLPGVVRGAESAPVAINTRLGYVLSGPCGTTDGPECVSTHLTLAQLHTQIARFICAEECPEETQQRTLEQELAEENFIHTHSRDTDGRFVVQLPTVRPIPPLTDSPRRAMRRYIQLEAKLIKNPSIYKPYSEFIQEYLDLGHMELAPQPSSSEVSAGICYLPHHCVRKISSSTSLRVVFDASCAQNRRGDSLNDFFANGPKLQRDLLDILLDFRCGSVALSADINKMYRQIRVHESQVDLLRIFWRSDPGGPVNSYRHLRLPYGLRPAGFLAVRCLQELALKNSDALPLAAKALRRSFYMDNLLYSCQNLEEARQLQCELIRLLRLGQFELRKWASSEPSLLQSVPACDQDVPLSYSGMEAVVPAAGLYWNQETDSLLFKIPEFPTQQALSKRQLLAYVSRIFDPLGYLAPCLVVLKLLMQTAWKSGASWDESLPAELCDQWNAVVAQLPALRQLRLPRSLLSRALVDLQIYGFADASSKAYAAVVYLRAQYVDRVELRLMVAKTKLAPLKPRSICRLELNASLLLAKCIALVRSATSLSFSSVNGFSDSRVALCWVTTDPIKLQLYVANRVRQIHQLAHDVRWCHVPGSSNLADLPSRGALPRRLLHDQDWWVGERLSGWILDPLYTYPAFDGRDCPAEAAAEFKKDELLSCFTFEEDSLIFRYSQLLRLQRITAWILRLAHNSRPASGPSRRGPLSVSELKDALHLWVKLTQRGCFPNEARALAEGKPIPMSSGLLSLTPFLDVEGIIRARGRIHHAHITYDQRHPIILPPKAPLTVLLINHYHELYRHANEYLVRSFLQQKYWIVQERSVVRRTLKKCVRCFRETSLGRHQLMGDLPPARVQPSPPFNSTGVDYAGPFLLKHPGRSNRQYKAYIAVFVCFATKCITLELVSSTSSANFISCLKRFIARRGKPFEIFSDCASTFVGANNELRRVVRSSLPDNVDSIHDFLANLEIQWHFIPPRSPHRGGLWEAQVKCVKYHLKRSLSSATLTYEEFSTALCQIEACLNSRPLCGLKSKVDELGVLTPAHFLVGRSLTALPEPSFLAEPTNRLSRWQLTQRAVQLFWSRWSTEYLGRLLPRPKWRRETPNLQVGQIVVLRDNKTPPCHWPLGRLTEVIPGPDGLVRTVVVQTRSGRFRRAVNQVSLLPFEDILQC